MDNIVFGESISKAVQHVVGRAWQAHTPEAMLDAAKKLQGMSTLIVFQTDDVRVYSDVLVRLNNERTRCEQAADMIAKGNL